MKRPPDSTVYRGVRRTDGGRILGAEVTRDGRPLDPRRSWSIRQHSPTGFEWGYGGSGPAQLALALVLDATGDRSAALDSYQWFKWHSVATWSDVWSITAGEVRALVEAFRDKQHEQRAAAPAAAEGGAA